jgi:hypothetical protein
MENRPVFKRRHYGTPETFTLITVNYFVVAGGLAMFTGAQHKIYWFFWVIFGLLAAYNVFSVYRYREEYNKVAIIAYIISLAGLGLIFWVF